MFFLKPAFIKKGLWITFTSAIVLFLSTLGSASEIPKTEIPSEIRISIMEACISTGKDMPELAKVFDKAPALLKQEEIRQIHRKWSWHDHEAAPGIQLTHEEKAFFRQTLGAKNFSSSQTALVFLAIHLSRDT